MTKARVHIGTSCLTKDLVWCDCGRGLSLSGKWSFCPNCGRPIDQESYQQATEEAKRNGATLYRNMDDDLLLNQLAEQERDMRQMVEALEPLWPELASIPTNIPEFPSKIRLTNADWLNMKAALALPSAQRLMKKGD